METVGRFLDWLHFRIPKEGLKLQLYLEGCLPTKKIMTSSLWTMTSHLKTYFIFSLRREIAKEDPTLDSRLMQWKKAESRTQANQFEKENLKDFLIHVPKDVEEWWPVIASVIIGLYGLLRVSENLDFRFKYLTLLSDHVKCDRVGQGKQREPKTGDEYFCIYSEKNY